MSSGVSWCGCVLAPIESDRWALDAGDVVRWLKLASRRHRARPPGRGARMCAPGPAGARRAAPRRPGAEVAPRGCVGPRRARRLPVRAAGRIQARAHWSNRRSAAGRETFAPGGSSATVALSDFVVLERAPGRLRVSLGAVVRCRSMTIRGERRAGDGILVAVRRSKTNPEGRDEGRAVCERQRGARHPRAARRHEPPTRRPRRVALAADGRAAVLPPPPKPPASTAA